MYNDLCSLLADINECASSPCKNAATCIDKVDGFSCTCDSGWTGVNCDTGMYSS